MNLPCTPANHSCRWGLVSKAVARIICVSWPRQATIYPRSPKDQMNKIVGLFQRMHRATQRHWNTFTNTSDSDKRLEQILSECYLTTLSAGKQIWNERCLHCVQSACSGLHTHWEISGLDCSKTWSHLEHYFYGFPDHAPGWQHNRLCELGQASRMRLAFTETRKTRGASLTLSRSCLPSTQ